MSQTSNLPAARRLLLSIHDVSPAHETRIARLIELIERHAGETSWIDSKRRLAAGRFEVCDKGGSILRGHPRLCPGGRRVGRLYSV